MRRPEHPFLAFIITNKLNTNIIFYEIEENSPYLYDHLGRYPDLCGLVVDHSGGRVCP